MVLKFGLVCREEKGSNPWIIGEIVWIIVEWINDVHDEELLKSKVIQLMIVLSFSDFIGYL